MNLLHCFYGLGATLGPVFTGWVSSHLHMSYRGAFIAVLSLCLVGIIATLCAPVKKSEGEKKNEKMGDCENNKPLTEEEKMASTFTIKSALAHPVVWIMGFAEGCIAGTENVTMNWAPLYLRDLYGWDPETRGARFVSGFFLLYTISRVVSGFIFDRIGTIRAFLLYLLTLICVFVGGFLLGEKGTTLLMSSGFFIAPLFPTVLTFATNYFGPVVDRCTCAIMFIYMIAGQLIQLTVGVVMKYIGIPWGYRLAVVLMVCLLGLVLMINHYLKKKKAKEEEEQLLPPVA